MRPIDADALTKDLNSLWQETFPRDTDTPDVKAERAAMCRAIDDVIGSINDFPTIGGWISVKDRLPGKYEPFYAACKSLTDDRENWVIEGIYKGMTYGGPWGVPMIEMGKAEVYACMPKELPEPPKED